MFARNLKRKVYLNILFLWNQLTPPTLISRKIMKKKTPSTTRSIQAMPLPVVQHMKMDVMAQQVLKTDECNSDLLILFLFDFSLILSFYFSVRISIDRNLSLSSHDLPSAFSTVLRAIESEPETGKREAGSWGDRSPIHFYFESRWKVFRLRGHEKCFIMAKDYSIGAADKRKTTKLNKPIVHSQPPFISYLPTDCVFLYSFWFRLPPPSFNWINWKILFIRLIGFCIQNVLAYV